MTSPYQASALVLAAALLAASSAFAADNPLAPLAPGSAPKASHAPYESQECNLCHERADPKRPGPVTVKGPNMCLDCHEEFATVLERAHVHKPVRRDCTACHNPHNASQRHLLIMEPVALCLDCHGEIDVAIEEAKVRHKALTIDDKCSNCHNPHASAVEKLLVARPRDLCLGCHDRDDQKSTSGKKLTNMKAWLGANPVWHDPVREEDCSACHESHGAEHPYLLSEYYPPEFYAPYSAERYELCFSCHKERAFSTEETTTLTGFRDGAKNLHYVHLHQGERGRTCRACHEVHASKQKLHVREGVPYGTRGWVLKLNYTKTPSGGSCEKTCHQKKTYTNRPGP